MKEKSDNLSCFPTLEVVRIENRENFDSFQQKKFLSPFFLFELNKKWATTRKTDIFIFPHHVGATFFHLQQIGGRLKNNIILFLLERSIGLVIPSILLKLNFLDKTIF